MQYLHTMVRVRNIDESLDFYCSKLGLEEVRRVDHEAGRFTLIFLAARDDKESGVAERAPLLELTYNWGVEQYDLGDAYGHIALGVDDIYGTCETIKSLGGKVSREPGPMKHGTTVIAFVEDPDGYKIELIQLGTQGSTTKQEAEAVAY